MSGSGSGSSSSSARREIAAIAKRPENLLCADCHTQNPQWASFNVGVFICMNCAGVHRSMGTHISKVRSVTLDEWDRGSVSWMSRMGNSKANSYWEYHLTPQQKHNTGILAGPAADNNVRAQFIRDKYERRTWYGQPPANEANLPNNPIAAATPPTPQAQSPSPSPSPSAYGDAVTSSHTPEPTREQRRQQRLAARRAASRGADAVSGSVSGCGSSGLSSGSTFGTPSPRPVVELDLFPTAAPPVTRSMSAPSFQVMKHAAPDQHTHGHPHTHQLRHTNGHHATTAPSHEPSSHDTLAQQLFAGLNVSPVHRSQPQPQPQPLQPHQHQHQSGSSSRPRERELARAASPWVQRPPLSASQSTLLSAPAAATATATATGTNSSPIPIPVTHTARTSSAPPAMSASVDLFGMLSTETPPIHSPSATVTIARITHTGSGTDLFEGLTQRADHAGTLGMHTHTHAHIGTTYVDSNNERDAFPTAASRTVDPLNLMSFVDPSTTVSTSTFTSSAAFPFLSSDAHADAVPSSLFPPVGAGTGAGAGAGGVGLGLGDQDSGADVGFSLSNMHIHTEPSPLDAFMQASAGTAPPGARAGSAPVPMQPSPSTSPVPASASSSRAEPVDLFADCEPQAVASTIWSRGGTGTGTGHMYGSSPSFAPAAAAAAPASHEHAGSFSPTSSPSPISAASASFADVGVGAGEVAGVSAFSFVSGHDDPFRDLPTDSSSSTFASPSLEPHPATYYSQASSPSRFAAVNLGPAQGAAGSGGVGAGVGFFSHMSPSSSHAFNFMFQ